MSLASGTIAATLVAPRHVSVLPIAIAAAMLSFLMLREPLLATWTSGAFVDTDDAMHLVQVRALLGGQGWFDMTAYGLDPPSGTFMHWSRIVDMPVALLIKGFGLFVDVTTAERLARLSFPFALLVGLYLAMARLAALLLGPRARLPAIGATLLSGDGIVQFLPGRIDHHAPQILLLVLMLAAGVAALDPARARQAAWVGLLASLSLSIGLEDLPFIAVLAIAIVGFWIWHGTTMARMLWWYAVGLAIGLPAFFVATVAPSRYLLPVCDAYGAAHLGAGLIAAAGCALAALYGARLPSRGMRLAAASVVGVLAGAFVALAYPACLHDPFAAVDPLVRDIWIRNVVESFSLLRTLRETPAVGLVSTLPVALGLVSCLVAIWCRRGLNRRRFALVATVVGAGLALGFWQVRVLTSVTAVALCGALYAAVPLAERLERCGRDGVAALAPLLIFPFTATAAAIVVPAALAAIASRDPPQRVVNGERAQPAAGNDLCETSEALAPLAKLAPGRVIAPIDLGSFLLAQTSMTVFSAAFHRDNDGNRFVFDTMMASQEDAARMAAGRDADYVMLCPVLKETALLTKRAPHGLAADLLAGRVPAWLAPVPLTATPITVYRVLRVSAR